MRNEEGLRRPPRAAPPRNGAVGLRTQPLETAMSLNKVTLIGHLSEEPKIQRCYSGLTRVGLSLVTDMDTVLNVETGEQRDGQEWHRVVVIEPTLVAFAEQNLDRDDRVYVQGQLQTSCWRDQAHHWRTLTHVLLTQAGDQLTRLEANDDVSGVTRTPERWECPA